MAGLVRHPHMLGYKFICPRNISSVNSHPFLKTQLLTLNSGHSVTHSNASNQLQHTHGHTDRKLPGYQTALPVSAQLLCPSYCQKILSQKRHLE